MAVTVKKIVLWRSEVDNKPGTLAGVIGPPAKAGADLKVVMGYRHADETRAAIEIYPITGRKQTSAAQSAGMSASAIPTLLVEGDDKPGLGHAIAESAAAAGINFAFFVAQVIGRKYSAVIGLENEADAKKAVGIIKKAVAPPKKKRP